MAVNKAAKEKIKTMKIYSQLELKLKIDPEKYREFLLHECEYNLQAGKKIGEIDGHITYKYTPTASKTIVKAECACGRIDDITDYDW